MREESSSRGFWVVVRPDSLKLVQVVSSQNRPVSCQVFKVVHDDGNEQVDDLKETKKKGVFPFKREMLSFYSYTADSAGSDKNKCRFLMSV